MKNIDNNINFSEDFKYPDDEPEEQIEQRDNIDILIRFSNILFTSPKPKVMLAAILFASNVDVGLYFGCENNIVDIAKQLGESRQNFRMVIEKIREDFSLQHTNTGKSSSSRAAYRRGNYRNNKL